MKSLLFIVVFFTALLMIQCSDDEPIKPIDPPIPVDTCYNEAPLTPHDSVRQLYPDRAYGISEIKVSSYNGYLAGEYYVNGWTIKDFIHGQFVYDPATEQVVVYLPAWQIAWSNDGKRLLLDNGFSGFRIFDIETMEYVSTIEIPNFVHPRWSLDENWIYGDGNGFLQRVRPDGSDHESFIQSIVGAKQIDSNRFVGFNYDGLYIYEVKKEKRTQIHFPELSSEEFSFSPSLKFELSPDRTKILADVYSLYRGLFEGRETDGLFLFDLEKKTVRKVLPRQYWGQEYSATWVTNETFYASYFCRTKSPTTSVSMVYEYDLDGNILQQITYPWMVLYPM